MSKYDLGLPKGMKDFGPEVMKKRECIFSTIKNIFNLFGYQNIETPAMENLSTLTGKYGDEGDKLLFRVLNSGDFLSKVPKEKISANTQYSDIIKYVADKGLKYDLTIPFARFVTMNRNALTFPFKRYQIQQVWRADKPQKGRYREFYQCDVDVIGSNSLLNEFELIKIVDEVFKSLNINVTLILNNRKIFNGILQALNLEDKMTEISVAVDKLDMMGIENVVKELIRNNINENLASLLIKIFTFKGAENEIFDFLNNNIGNTEMGRKGIDEMHALFGYIRNDNISMNIKFDISLARGLDYYTGTIFEVKANDVDISSICGGGRYDNLTAAFGLPDVSGVGISFGADRIYDVMNELELFNDIIADNKSVLILNFGEKAIKYSLPLVNLLRQNRFVAEIYPDNHKLQKQLNYANKKNISFVVFAGETEIKENKYAIKNMISGKQHILSIDEVINFLNM